MQRRRVRRRGPAGRAFSDYPRGRRRDPVLGRQQGHERVSVYSPLGVLAPGTHIANDAQRPITQLGGIRDVHHEIPRLASQLRERDGDVRCVHCARGGAYAAATLPPNSVGTKQLKDSAVTKKKLAPEQSFVTPTLASGVTAIGPPNPPFSDPGYMKDNFGFVHLKGTYNCGGTLGRFCSSFPRATDRADRGGRGVQQFAVAGILGGLPVRERTGELRHNRAGFLGRRRLPSRGNRRNLEPTSATRHDSAGVVPKREPGWLRHAPASEQERRPPERDR